MQKKEVKKVNDKIFAETQIPLRKKIWFYLTCWRPVTKYEMNMLQTQLVIILEGMRESDMMHYKTEQVLADNIKQVIDIVNGKKKDSPGKKPEDQMYG
jgi:hypothetical protein